MTLRFRMQIIETSLILEDSDSRIYKTKDLSYDPLGFCSSDGLMLESTLDAYFSHEDQLGFPYIFTMMEQGMIGEILNESGTKFQYRRDSKRGGFEYRRYKDDELRWSDWFWGRITTGAILSTKWKLVRNEDNNG